MKKLLEKNWVGVLCVLLVAVVASITYTSIFMTGVKKYAPQVIQEMKAFLPITIKNGEIVAPTDAYIKKTYGSQEKGTLVDIILDTRTTDFSMQDLTNEGMYINKKCIYIKNRNEIKTFCFNDIIDEVLINEAALYKVQNYFEQNLGKYIGLVLWVFLVIIYYLAILVYSLLVKLVSLFFGKYVFKQIFLLNSLVYSLFTLLSLVFGLECGFLLKLILFAVVDILLLKKMNQDN